MTPTLQINQNADLKVTKNWNFLQDERDYSPGPQTAANPQTTERRPQTTDCRPQITTHLLQPDCNQYMTVPSMANEAEAAMEANESNVS